MNERGGGSAGGSGSRQSIDGWRHESCTFMAHPMLPTAADSCPALHLMMGPLSRHASAPKPKPTRGWGGAMWHTLGRVSMRAGGGGAGRVGG